jgi:hypothetical protein
VITHVAIKDANGRVYALPKPGRHPMLFERFPELRTVSTGGLLLTRTGQVQGFIIDGHGCSDWFISDDPERATGGRFADRTVAAEHAIATGLIKKLNWPPLLYSEDLW